MAASMVAPTATSKSHWCVAKTTAATAADVAASVTTASHGTACRFSFAKERGRLPSRAVA